MARGRTVAWLLGTIVSSSAAAETAPPPPTLDCTLGFDGLRAAVYSLPGATPPVQETGFDVVTLAAPDTWSVRIEFTQPWNPAHPAATIRTLRKQVTGVWTADSKGCGFGDADQFGLMMAGLKANDTEITNASRAEVERQKRERSPLAPLP